MPRTRMFILTAPSFRPSRTSSERSGLSWVNRRDETAAGSSGSKDFRTSIFNQARMPPFVF